jgi:hypothetical protein
MPPSSISIEIPLNGIFRKKSILAYFDDPQYRRKDHPKLPISASYGSQIPNSPNPIIKGKRLGIGFENKVEGVSEVGILDKLPMV